MKVLWHSNAPWVATGYGQQTALFAPRIQDLGHEVAISAFYGLQGAKLSWRSHEVYPGGYDTWSNDVLAAHAFHHFEGDYQAGWIMTLADCWVFKNPSLAKFNIASWTPVDHMPVPPDVYRFFEETRAVPIAMSRFGEAQLQRIGLEPLYVPHGIDRELLKPVDHKLARQAIDAPEDAFVVGMVAANKGASPPRKAFGQAFQAFGAFRRKHPDAILYLHTERHGFADGIDLDSLAAATGIPEDAIRWVDQYQYRLGTPPVYMAAAYSAMDVLLNPAYGEGFGVPIIEAQACGTPVIASDFTAMPELVGGGWTVKGQPFWDPFQRAWLHDPSVTEINRALERAYKLRGSDKIRQAALDKAAEYDADLVAAEHWKPVLERLADKLEAAPANVTPVDQVAALAKLRG
jgi:glycosyltransferase involved in cell wall biosynthesis